MDKLQILRLMPKADEPLAQKADAQVDAPLAHKQIIRQRRMRRWMRLWRTSTKLQIQNVKLSI